ncbi:flippase [Scheffersomyces xylosifermentans]|uniref:flippase n=1 Tax=Scheffersomyces xylosifermentans TaxID=1304137 RepID=UPI00315D2C7B
MAKEQASNESVKPQKNSKSIAECDVNIEQEDANAALLQKSSRGVPLLISVQFLTKLLTFLLNQLLIRYVTPRVFGVSAYLEFLVSTVLFFSREGVRLSVQRIESNNRTEKSSSSSKIHKYNASSKSGVHQSVINFGFIPIIIGIPITTAIFYWQYQSSAFQESLVQLPFHKITLALIGSSVFLELILEPIYALNQYQLNFTRRSQSESLAVFNRCILTFGSVYFAANYSNFDGSHYEGAGVLSFAIGQFAYSFTLFAWYFYSFCIEDSEITFSFQRVYYSTNSYYYLEPKIFTIWKGLFVQMLFKQLLTEGDKLLINYLCTVEEQGVYSVVTNYGSIVARLLFQPIEEAMRLLFTKLLSSTTPSETSVNDSYRTIKLLSIFYFNLSVLIVLAGFTNSSFLLKSILGNSKWSQTSIFDVFPQYTIYIPFLAFNGILEAFFSSIATNEDIRNFSIYMTASTIIVLSSSYFFIAYAEMGLTGLILSNIVNMSLRIGYCYTSIKKFYNKHSISISLSKIFTNVQYGLLAVFISEFVSYKIILKGETLNTRNIFELLKSFFNCLGCLLILCFLERNNLKELVIQIRSKALKRKSE